MIVTSQESLSKQIIPHGLGSTSETRFPQTMHFSPLVPVFFSLCKMMISQFFVVSEHLSGWHWEREREREREAGNKNYWSMCAAFCAVSFAIIRKGAICNGWSPRTVCCPIKFWKLILQIFASGEMFRSLMIAPRMIEGALIESEASLHTMMFHSQFESILSSYQNLFAASASGSPCDSGAFVEEVKSSKKHSNMCHHPFHNPTHQSCCWLSDAMLAERWSESESRTPHCSHCSQSAFSSNKS